MNLRNFGGLEKILYCSSTNFLIVFELSERCNKNLFISSCNDVLGLIELFSCYGTKQGFQKMDSSPVVQETQCDSFFELIESLLSKSYSEGEHWIDVIYTDTNNSIIVSMDHTLGDIPTILNFIHSVAKAYNGKKIDYEPLSLCCEDAINQVNSISMDTLNYGNNKGCDKKITSVSIKDIDISSKEIFKSIQSAYFEVTKEEKIKFDLTVDLRKFYPSLVNKSGYYCDIVDFIISKKNIDGFYDELKNRLSNFLANSKKDSFSDFYNIFFKHQMACTFISEKGSSLLDKDIVSNIFPYGNAFYLSHDRILSFVMVSYFNKNLNISFCHDLRTISKDEACTFGSILTSKLKSYLK